MRNIILEAKLKKISFNGNGIKYFKGGPSEVTKDIRVRG